MSLNLKYCINTEKTKKSFGELFSTIDFELDETLTNQNFFNTGKKTVVGTLMIGNHTYKVNMHDLKRIEETVKSAYETVFKKYKLGLMK